MCPAAKFVIRYGYLVIGAVVALIIPFALHAVTFRQTTELTYLAPRNSPGVQAYTRMSELFSPGLLDPYAVGSSGRRTLHMWPSSSVWTDEKGVQE